MKFQKSLIVTLIGITSISQAGTLSGHVKYEGKHQDQKNFAWMQTLFVDLAILELLAERV